MSFPVALSVKLSKTTQTCCGKEGVKTLNEFSRECNFNPKPLDYYGCISSIKEFVKKNAIEIKSNKSYCVPKVSTLLTGALKGAKPIYNAILGEKEKSNTS